MRIDNRYNIISKISETNSNIVYNVSDKNTGKTLALKLLKTSEPIFCTRFKKEYHILQTLTHPSIVDVYDLASTKYKKRESLYFTMDFIDGIPVNQYFRKNGYERFLQIFLETLHIIKFIHKKGLMHCDLKPHHILVDKSGRIKLIDFGFSLFKKSIDLKEIGGTLRYIAPEILKGEDPDARTEIYSLGIIMYESLTSSKVFDSKKTNDIIQSVLNKPLSPIHSKKDVPDFLKGIILKMTDKLRMNRYSSVEAVIEAIENKGRIQRKKKNIDKVLFSNFIGREEYLKTTFKLLNKSSQGQGQILFFEGLTGIGKTRLLKEIEYRLFLEGKNIQYTRIIAKEEQNFDWLLQLLKRTGSKLTHLRELIKKGEVNLSGNHKYLFFENIEKELKELLLKQKKTLVFVVDDINLVSKILSEFILYTSNYIEKNRIFLIFATEIIPEHFLRTIEKGGYDNIQRVILRGLNKQETSIFIKNLLGVVTNIDSLNSFVFEKTEGTPYFTEELLKEIVERKLLTKSGNKLIYDISELKKIPVPKNVASFVQERIKKLSYNEKELLKIVSVFGVSIPHFWLTNLSPFSEFESLKVCQSLYNMQFISISHEQKYDFTHKILKELIYNEIKKKEKINIHNKVYKFLKTIKETPYILQQKAFHSYTANSPEAELFLYRILRKALKSQDIETAIECFKKLYGMVGKNLLKEIDVDSLVKIGNYFTRLGEYDNANNLYTNLLAAVINKKDRINILHNLAVLKTVKGEYKKAEKVFKDLLAITKKPKDRRFELLTDFGWLYFCKGDYVRAEEMYRDGFTLSSQLKRKILLGKLFYNLGILKQQTEAFEEAKDYGKKALRISNEFNNQSYKIASLDLLGRIEQQRRRYNNAIPYYKKALKHLDKTKDLLRSVSILRNLSLILYRSGQLDSCEKGIINGLNLAKKLGNLNEIAYLFYLYGTLLSREGEFQAAEDFLKKSYDIGVSINDYYSQFSSITELSLIFAFKGKKNEFDEYHKKAIGLEKYISDKKELLKIDLIRGTEKFVSQDYKRSISNFGKIESTIGKINAPEYQIPAIIYMGLSLSRIGKRKDGLEVVKHAKKIMKSSTMYLFKEEIDLAEIELDGAKISIAIENRIKKLITNTEFKKQRFLYARFISLLSDIRLKQFRKKKDNNYLLEGFKLLKEAKVIFEEIDASTFSERVNNQFIEIIDDFIRNEAIKPKKERYLEILKELGETIRHIDNPEELKVAFLSLAKRITGAERGLFLTFDENSEDFYVTGKDIDNVTIKDAKMISKNVIKRVKKTKRPLISYDAKQDKRFSKSESVLINDIKSILCIPIISEDRVFGTLYLDSRKKHGLFSKADEDFFTSLSNLLAGSLKKSLEYKEIEEETVLLKKQLIVRFGPKNIIGKSSEMQDVFDKIERAAKTDIPVLILGETGTGKELVVGTIHLLSKRKEKTFSIVDCVALPPSLLESELFGYTKGAFTGAKNDKKGILEASKGGTLFIDEIGDASNAVQSNLLRFLDTGEVKKIGAIKHQKVNTRIIAATNKDLQQLVAIGKFREDLYYRLNKFIIHLPTLRERKEDIKPLIEHFIELFNRKYNKSIQAFESDTFELMLKYDWPGNIRELESEIERCVLYCDKTFITKELLSPRISRLPPRISSLKEMDEVMKVKHIQNTLDFTGGNITKTAQLLKINRKTIQRLLKKHRIKNS